MLSYCPALFGTTTFCTILKVQLHNYESSGRYVQYVSACINRADTEWKLVNNRGNRITLSVPSMSVLVMKRPCIITSANQEFLSLYKVPSPSGFCSLLLCLPRMKRGLQGNEEEDGGGTSGGSQETLKRSLKQKRKKDLEEEGAHWECLPQEILLHIFQYLPLLDRAYASQVPM